MRREVSKALQILLPAAALLALAMPLSHALAQDEEDANQTAGESGEAGIREQLGLLQ